MLESVWVVIFLTPSAKLSLSLPSTKYLFVNYEKYSHSLMGFEALDYISVHKKSSHPPPNSPSKFVRQLETASGELQDVDAITG